MTRKQVRKQNVVAYYQKKGGVGKTTTTIQFAVYCAEVGKKILCLDMDSQGNLSTVLNGNVPFAKNRNDHVDGVSEILFDGKPFADVVRKTSFEELGDNQIDFISVGSEFTNKDLSALLAEEVGAAKTAFEIYWNYNEKGQVEEAEENLVKLVSRESYRAAIRSGDPDRITPITLLRDWLDPVKDDYDFVFIDVNPTRNVIADICLFASDYVVSPAQLDGYSQDAVGDLLSDIRRINESGNDDLCFAGILFTGVNTNTRIAGEMATYIWNHIDYPEDNLIGRVIRYDSTVIDANTKGTPLSFFSKKSRAGTDYIYAAKLVELIDDEEAEKLLEEHGIKGDTYNFDLDPEIREEKNRKKKEALMGSKKHLGQKFIKKLEG